MMITSLVDLTIDLAALRHNYLQLRGRLSPGVKLLAVVKADAYGHGLVPVARTLAGAGAEYLGVASVEEGLALRQAGIDLPVVLLLGIVPQEARAAVSADLEVTLYRKDVAQALEEAGRSLGKKARVHLKVDTGMGRLGLLPPEVLPFLESLKNFPDLEVLGLISHLAMADVADKTYTRKQLQVFLDLLTAARNQGWELPYSHIANSAALMDMPENHENGINRAVVGQNIAADNAANGQAEPGVGYAGENIHHSGRENHRCLWTGMNWSSGGGLAASAYLERHFGGVWVDGQSRTVTPVDGVSASITRWDGTDVNLTIASALDGLKFPYSNSREIAVKFGNMPDAEYTISINGGEPHKLAREELETNGVSLTI